jgi:hypothetical protein
MKLDANEAEPCAHCGSKEIEYGHADELLKYECEANLLSEMRQ